MLQPKTNGQTEWIDSVTVDMIKNSIVPRTMAETMHSAAVDFDVSNAFQQSSSSTQTQIHVIGIGQDLQA